MRILTSQSIYFQKYNGFNISKSIFHLIKIKMNLITFVLVTSFFSNSVYHNKFLLVTN